MELFGKNLTKTEILKKIGDISQLGGVKSYEFADGKARGIRAVDIKSPSGIDMTILLDRCMDISSFTFRNIPICWRSATRETSAVYHEDKGMEFLRSFFGGLLVTCGLDNVGSPSVDDGQELGLHGRISNLPAENVHADGIWEGDSYVMRVQGKIRDATVFGDKLELTRKITVRMDSPGVLIEDVVENTGFQSSPLMMLYHFNFGFPLLDSTSELITGNAKTTPRDDQAEIGIGESKKFDDPIQDYKEKVYFHDIEKDPDGNCSVALVNRKFNGGQGLGISLKYNKDSLPHLVQWKQMGFGEYVCGLEPANCLVMGRSTEREKGTLRFIEPGQKVYHRLEFNILESNKDIANCGV
jgi:hypothetical protein